MPANSGSTVQAAYMNCNTKVIQLLIEKGVNPNFGVSHGYPPIFRTLDDASYEKFVFFLGSRHKSGTFAFL